MAADIRQRGRPRGESRAALSTWMEGRKGFTMGELMRSLGWEVDKANKALQRAKESGEVRITGTQACEGVKRPVAVFAPTAAERGCADLHQVMRLWSPGRTG